MSGDVVDLTHANEGVRATLSHGDAFPQSKTCGGFGGKFAHNLPQADHFLRPLPLRVWGR